MTTTPRPIAPLLAAAALLLPLAGACQAEGGEACRIDSDCGAGLLCALDGHCATLTEVQAAFSARPDAGAPPKDSGAPPDPGPTNIDAAGCLAPGAFGCEPPADVRKVTNLFLHPQGNGAARLAGVANPVLESSFGDGTLAMDLWLEGSYAPGCTFAFAFVRGPEDIGADCQPVYEGRMPFEIPDLVAFTVYEGVLDPATHILSGYLDKAELIASMDPALRSTADGLIDVDLDTDGDGTPDKSTVILTVTLE
jgi:hypothetical protein